MITKLVYSRLFNLGNYENHRIDIEITVEGDDVPAAFAVARAAVESQHAVFQAEKDEAEKRRREEWEAEMERRRQDLAAKSSLRKANAPDDDPPF